MLRLAQILELPNKRSASPANTRQQSYCRRLVDSRVSESDGEADMYLWMGADLAPAAVFRFVAAARQDRPGLLAAARQ